MDFDSLPIPLKLDDEQLKQCLNNIENSVRAIWEQPLHNHYTRHGLNHSEKIVTIIGELLESNQDFLNEDERFIIIASTYLHDIGMQFPEYSGLMKRITYSNTELEIIRNNHHEASANIISDSIDDKHDISLGLDRCKEYAPFIAEVSRHHRKLSLSMGDGG